MQIGGWDSICGRAERPSVVRRRTSQEDTKPNGLWLPTWPARGREIGAGERAKCGHQKVRLDLAHLH